MAKKDQNSGVHTDPEVLAKMQNLEAAPEFAGWEEENLSLPPYFLIERGKHIGAGFAARVIMVDDSDKDFPRYVLEALAPLQCFNGPRDEAIPVDVKIGDYFTCSMYAGLPLHRYVGCRVVVKCDGTRKTDQPQPMYTFRMVMHPEDKKMIIEDRKVLAAQAVARFREARKNAGALPARGETVQGTA